MVQEHLRMLSPSALGNLRTRTRSYLRFREDVDGFLLRHFSAVCTETCYLNFHSACCSREGITTFFADVVINVLMSSDNEVERLLQVLGLPNLGLKCIYLGKKGCLWRIKPIVCEMFLCKPVRKKVFGKEPQRLKDWENLRRREKRYTWPNRPVLFDQLEAYFLEKGYDSSLMYCHNSPGLLRVKALARKGSKTTPG